LTPLAKSQKESIIRRISFIILPENLAKKMGELSRTRNILAHQYLSLKWEKLKSFIEEAPWAVKEFICSVNHLLEPDND